MGRRIKGPIPNEGICTGTLVGTHKDCLVIEIKKKGVPHRFRVKYEQCSPNWPENMDLKARYEEIVGSTQTPRSVGVNSMAAAFEAAVFEQSPEINHKEDGEASKKPVSSTPKLQKTALEKAAPEKTTISGLFVGLDAKPEWTARFDDLKEAIADIDNIQMEIDAANRKMDDHMGFVALCVTELEKCNVKVQWASEPAFKTKKSQAALKPETKKEKVKTFNIRDYATNPTPEGSMTPTELRDKLKVLLKIRPMRIEEVAKAVNHDLNVRFKNIFYAATNRMKKLDGLKAEKLRGSCVKLYYIK